MIIISGIACRTPQQVYFSEKLKSAMYHWQVQSCATPCRRIWTSSSLWTAVIIYQGLHSPRKPLGAVIISHPSTQLLEALTELLPSLIPANSWVAITKQGTVQDCQKETTKAALHLKSHLFSRTYMLIQQYSDFSVMTSFSRFPGCSWKKLCKEFFPRRTTGKSGIHHTQRATIL